MTVNTAAWVCLTVPLLATVLITLGGNRLSRRGAGYISTGSTMIAFAASIVALVAMIGESPDARSHTSTAWTWLSAGQYNFGLTLLTDQLSIMMMLVVTGVGSLIVAYSVGYMEGENEERRYFAYMSLFVFSMLLLVQSGNLLLLLAGWGMVGLSSYLLIGFYQERHEAVAAAKKAFIMNAFGDAVLALALFLIIQQTGQLDYAGVFAAAPHGGTIATLIALGLLGGALAKSAQIPLHTWLPDAMEGPTPVSALIHAATMVTAGVYLIVRCNPLFADAHHVQDTAAALGALTLLMAGLIAIVQVDIKRVIAYSTMSQIGYMFVGAGIGAYSAAMFHLMAHAFFKALLFLGAGIIIHALSGEQDIGKMGGLARRLPHTRWAFLIGSLALVGIPPLTGFFSKDAIIDETLTQGGFGYVLFAACVVGTFFTGLYAFRLFFRVFYGEESAFAKEHLHKPHGRLEGPLSMVWTVTVLTLLSAFAGFLQFSPLWAPLTSWLDPVAPPLAEPSTIDDVIGSTTAVVLGLSGMWVAYACYIRKSIRIPKPVKLFEKKFYWDELYNEVFYKPADLISRGLGRFFEIPVIAGSLGEITQGFRFGAGETAKVQNGLVRFYALALASGIAVLAVVFIAAR
jgi:NADH-quinone oxidoreductase subunit L